MSRLFGEEEGRFVRDSMRVWMHAVWCILDATMWRMHAWEGTMCLFSVLVTFGMVALNFIKVFFTCSLSTAHKFCDKNQKFVVGHLLCRTMLIPSRLINSSCDTSL